MNRHVHATHTTALRGALAGAVVAACLLCSAQARADIDVRINIGNAPPPPRFVFHARPHERYFPGERVYVVDDPGVGDNDVFRYGGYYWVFSDGYWYRSLYWRGPFRVIQPRYVPDVFYRMPPTRWKHHPSGPPGHMQPGGPPGHMQPGGPPGHMQPGGPPGHMLPGGPPGHMLPGGPPGHMQPHGGNPPGHGKQGNRPPGQQKKDARGDDKGGGHGK